MQVSDECSIVGKECRRWEVGVRSFKEIRYEPSECYALEVGHGKIDFGSVRSESDRTIGEVELALGQEVPEFLGVCAIEFVRRSDFGLRSRRSGSGENDWRWRLIECLGDHGKDLIECGLSRRLRRDRNKRKRTRRPGRSRTWWSGRTRWWR